MSSQSVNPDNDLARFYTDTEYLRGVFKKSVAANTLPKRILVIHGVGCVGKSSLLRMFRLHCKSIKIPIALASGDDAKSVLDVLTHWVNDLKAENVAFASFDKAVNHYRTIQAKVDKYAENARDAHSRVRDIAGKVVSKTAEAASGALTGAAIGSIIPGIGTAIGGVLGGVLGGMGGEALADWLRGFLTISEIDLLLDPAKELTDKFLIDIAKAADKRRIVLMLDTFEQMTVLDDWTRDIAQQLSTNVLLVIAGRALPNWSRVWQGWMANAQIEELKPMSEENMLNLVRRYYATIRAGEPNPKQVEAIIRFAHGLPMVLTGAVQLWVKYDIEDFQSVKPEIVANLVDRLMEGVPSALIPALEASAAVRWFDQPILRAVTGLTDVREVYNELRLFPFVRTRSEGLALHDAVREIIDENLLVQDSERHSELHKRAAKYFEKRLEKALGEEIEQMGLERLYHCIRADEEAGIKVLREKAEELVRYLYVGRLRTLINDMNTYSLVSPNSHLWRDYYNARLLHITVSSFEAEKIYVKISEDNRAEKKLRAYALCDLAQIWACNSYMSRPGGLEKAFLAIEQSMQLIPEMDSKLALNFLHLRYVYMFKGELDKAVDALIKQYNFYKSINDKNGTVYSLDMLKDIYGLLGDWNKASSSEKEGIEILTSLPENPFLYTRLVGHNIWYKVWSGRYSDAEKGMKQALNLAEREEQVDNCSGLCRDLGFVLGLQKQWSQSQEYFSKSAKKYLEHNISHTGLASSFGFQGFIFAHQGEFQKAEEYLTKSLSYKKEIQDNNGIPEILFWMGEMYEMKAKQVLEEEKNIYLIQSESYFSQCLDYRWTSRRYFECAALSGLMRVNYMRNKYEDAVAQFIKAERIAQEYSYHDLMASQYLFKAHIQWLGLIESWSNGFNAAELSYKRSMLHALSYNRFLLDEVVWFEQYPSPLINIVTQCSTQGADGRRMIEILANWWETNVTELVSDIYGEVLSSEMNGVPLTQVERLSRQREPGDGTFQPGVTEMFNRYLNS